MADHKIRFTLTSLFHGEGMTKAGGAVDALGRKVKKATSSVGQLGDAFGSLGGTVGKISGAIGGVFSSLAGGPITIAITAITALTGAFLKWRDSVEETRKKNEELRQQMLDGSWKRIHDAIDTARRKQVEFFDTIITKGRDALKALEAIRNAQLERRNSERGIESAKAEGEISWARFQGEKQKGATNDEFQKRRIEQDTQKKILDIKVKQYVNDYQSQVDGLKNKQTEISNRLKNIDEETRASQSGLQASEEGFAKASTARGNDIFSREMKLRRLKATDKDGKNKDLIEKNEKAIADLKEKQKEDEKAIEEARKKTADNILKLENEKKVLLEQQVINANNQKKAEQQYINKMNDFNTEEAKIFNEKRKIDQDEADKKKKDAEEAANKKKQEDEKARAEEKRKRDDAARKKAKADTKAAIEEAEVKTKAIDKQIEQIKTRQENFKKGQQQGMAADHQKHDGLFGPYKYHLDSNGNIASVSEALRAERYGARGTKEENQAKHRRQVDDNKADRLRKRRYNTLSKSEKKWLSKYYEMRTREKDAEKMKILQEEKDKAVVDMKKKVDMIESNLEKALECD